LFTTTLHFFFREPLKMAKKMEKGYWSLLMEEHFR
jgi:hypothetical protein